jgi:hypothetical protein
MTPAWGREPPGGTDVSTLPWPRRNGSHLADLSPASADPISSHGLQYAGFCAPRTFPQQRSSVRTSVRCDGPHR